MNHRWDDVTRREASRRREAERYEAARIERDRDVERRDQIAAASPAVQQSPWEIGLAFYDQRDLYTRDSRTGAAGYGRGPSVHPAEGSYAYVRPPARPSEPRQTGASIYEREAWPWLNYHPGHAEPAPPPRPWERLKVGAGEVKDRLAASLHVGKRPGIPGRSDDRIGIDVVDALRARDDIDASDIDVTVHEAEVTLAGTVPDRRTKRLAEEIAEGVLAVRDVHNRLTIRPEDPTDANVAFVLPLLRLGT